MVLVDSAVWIAHPRRDNAALIVLLAEGRVLGHPFVGELACGSLQRRAEIPALLEALPQLVLPP